MPTIAQQRLAQQRLAQPDFKSSAEVVAWMGAVQAQEYLLALWALGMRMEQADEAIVEQAFQDGEILRTHVMRPTWHFVARADIRWLLELTAPRVHAVNAYMYRKLELDEALFAKSDTAIRKALEGGKHLTRVELGEALAQAGIPAEGMRLGYIVHKAELDAIVVSGGRDGKQFTYALLDERAPDARSLPREEALAELVRRYFTSHGPATAHDFAWWSGLTMTDTKAGLEMVKGELVSDVLNGKTYWRSSAIPDVREPSPTAHFLPPYDEYTMYRSSDAVMDAAHLQQAKTAEYWGLLVIDGQLIGNWRRDVNKSIHIDIQTYRPMTKAERAAVDEAGERYGKFMGLPVEIA